MIINQTTIEPGQERKINVDIAKLPSHSPINVNITVFRAINPGPVLLLMAGLHGDEVNGIEIVRRILEEKHHHVSCGTVICIPIINVYGFIHFSRYVPDGKDVNRSFPGNKNGSLASRVASFMTKEILPVIDYGVDFHTGGADRFNFPQIRAMLNHHDNEAVAKAFAAPFTINSRFRAGSLRHAASKLGKPILVYEGGESSRFDDDAITNGVHGAMRVMHYLGMQPDNPFPNQIKSKRITKSYWIRAKSSGMFQSTVQNGGEIEKNGVLGFITDPFGEYKIAVKANRKGYIIGLNNSPVVHQGDALAHIGEV